MKNGSRSIRARLACLALLALAAGPAAAEDVALGNGGRIHYVTAGAGERALVFAHGYSFSSDVWEKVLQRLPQGYRAIAYDLRGNGASDKPDGGYTYEQMAEDLAQFMDALKLQRAVLVGPSMGAMLIQDFAAAHPERVAGMVLSNSQARQVAPPGMSEAFQKRIDAYGTPEQNRAVFAASTPRYFKAGNLPDADLARFLAVNMQSATPALKQGFTTVLTAPAIPPERWSRLADLPAMIVTSTHDIVPFAVAVRLSEGLPKATIAVVENAGHTPMWERPDRFAQHLAAFLATLP